MKMKQNDARVALTVLVLILATVFTATASAGKKRREASRENEAAAKAYCDAQTDVDCKVIKSNVLGCGGKNWKKAKKFGGKGQDYLACTRAVFAVNVHFVFAVPEDKADLAWVRAEIANAERIYSADPPLRIKPTYLYETERGGRDLDNLTFDSDRKFHKYMDDHFDHVAMSKTTGYLQVLVQSTQRGKANFPHNVQLATRKHGPRLQMGVQSTFAHELGHIFGLLHTFERYTGGSRCNKDYKKGESGKGKTRKPDGSINVMDYGRGSRTTYLNSCQSERAAKKRKQWMTNGGKVNYKQIRGSR